MQLSEFPGAVKRCREKLWKFQKTFLTPVRDLAPFAKAIVTDQGFQGSEVIVDQVIFEPENLNSLLANYSILPRRLDGLSLIAQGEQETAALVEAALGDSINFFFIPEPERFVIFADHDEYSTFFANIRSEFDHIVTKLSEQGFEPQDYERQL